MPKDDVKSTSNCDWGNIKQAALYLGVSIAFLRKAVRLRSVPFARVGSKVIRFRRSDLDRWLETTTFGAEAIQAREGAVE